jgi:steroid delta-isomerase-like uncharacterized protein
VVNKSVDQGISGVIGADLSRRAMAKLTAGALLGGAAVTTAQASARAQDATPAGDATCPTTTEEENIAIAERYWAEVWTAGGEAAVADLLTEDEVHHWGVGGSTTGHADFTERLVLFLEAFPDFAIQVDQAIADGDLVFNRWTATGTHEGTWMGIEPTETAVEYTGMQVFRIECGKIAESWGEANHLSLLRQLGGLPDMAPPDATPAP